MAEALTAEEEFIAGLPATEERMSKLLAGKLAIWHFAPGEGADAVVGTVRFRPDNPGGRLWLPRPVASRALERGESGDLKGAFGLQMEGRGPLVAWCDGASTPDAINFIDQQSKESLAPDFATALYMARLLDGAVAVDFQADGLQGAVARYADTLAALHEVGIPHFGAS